MVTTRNKKRLTTETIDITDDDPFPFGSSHWDRLPNELKAMVLKYNSPFKLFLRGQFKLDPQREAEDIHLIWMEAFDTDWPGDLKKLPEPRKESPIQNHELARVKSRSMYERLCNRFPNASEEYFEKRYIDRRITTAVLPFKPSKREPGSTPPQQELRLLHIPMRHMWLDLLGNKLEMNPHALANDCLIESHIDLLRHLVDFEKIDLKKIMRVCVIQGNEQVYNVMNVVAERGHFELLKMLHEAGCGGITTKAMDWAASNGDFEIVKWLHEDRKEGCTTAAMDGAAMNGRLDIVKWLHENRTEGASFKAMDGAATNGHLDIVKWLHENRTEGCSTNAMDGAAGNGHLETVKWLHKNRTQGCTSQAIDDAAELGYTNVVRFLLHYRDEEVSDDGLVRCKSAEIAQMLVASFTLERKREMESKAISEEWTGHGVAALRKSLAQKEKSFWIISDDESVADSDCSYSTASYRSD